NSVLNGVPAGASGEDTYRLGDLNVAADGACAVRVREAPDHAAALDAAELLVIDHAAGVSAYSANGTILLGKPQGASHVASLEGSDLTSKLTGGGGCTLGPGDTLVVELGPGGGASPLLLAASGPGPVEVGIPDGQGGWQPATPCYPRAAPDELTLPAPGSDRVRLSCASSASLTFVGHLAVSAVASAAQRVSLVSAHDARLGEAAGAVASRDSVSLTLLGPDTLTLRYVLPPQPQDATRDYLLRLSATPLDPGTLAPATLRQHEELPSRFALRQNEPNPFSAATVIRFDLPVGAPVRLELFDAQGRRLTTLANRYFPPGYHAVAWARAAGGGSVEPGVYFCRIEAGPFRERRKMVLLPRK
ncbi:MAG: hypothetical protein HZC42_05765, partial [Candidatus Eisenbacteria bacterium]|nr:hypothetical protein [Candidatus Eisenbacteria bacterium]